MIKKPSKTLNDADEYVINNYLAVSWYNKFTELFLIIHPFTILCIQKLSLQRLHYIFILLAFLFDPRQGVVPLRDHFRQRCQLPAVFIRHLVSCDVTATVSALIGLSDGHVLCRYFWRMSQFFVLTRYFRRISRYFVLSNYSMRISQVLVAFSLIYNIIVFWNYVSRKINLFTITLKFA